MATRKSSSSTSASTPTPDNELLSENEMLFDEKGESQSYYVALFLAQDPVNKANPKVPTLIYVTTSPLDDPIEHNQGNAKQRFAGKSGGAQCKLQQIIGPFSSLEQANEIRDDWKKNARGLVGRGLMGRVLAARHGKKCWDAHADRDYVKATKCATRKKEVKPKRRD